MLQPWHLEVFFSWLPSGLGSLVQSELQPVLLIIVLTVLSLLFLNCLDFVFLDTVVVQLLIWVWFFATPRIAACQASLSFTTSRNLLKLMSIESVIPSNHLILCRTLLFLPPIFPSIRLFSDESALRIRWPNYWSFSFSNSPSNEYSGWIFFRIDWFDLLAIQGTLKFSPGSQLEGISSEIMIHWHLEVIAHSYKISPDKDPCPFGTLPKTLLLDGPLLLKYSYKLSKSRPLPEITPLPSLWDTTLQEWAFPVLMELILMPKTQVVDHCCFLKKFFFIYFY